MRLRSSVSLPVWLMAEATRPVPIRATLSASKDFPLAIFGAVKANSGAVRMDRRTSTVRKAARATERDAGETKGNPESNRVAHPGPLGPPRGLD